MRVFVRKGIAVTAIATSVTGAIWAGQMTGLWTVGGQNIENTRNQPAETRIGVATAPNLAVAWSSGETGDISATPAVDGTAVYFPDWKGDVYALDRNTGAQLWKVAVASVTGVPASASGSVGGVVRATPAVAGNALVMGDQGGRLFQGAKVFALDRRTGSTLWVTQVQGLGADPGQSSGDDTAIVTTPAIVDENNPDVAYVGVAAFEEGLTAFIPGYQCCSFRGSVVALSVKTGQVLWRTYTIPKVAGYSGGGVWGATGAIDPKRRTLYVTTGNNYSIAPADAACVAAATTPEAKGACMAAGNYFDSILALDTQTGRIKWATMTEPYDTWNVNCIPGFPVAGTCPSPEGPDYDFSQGAMLLSARINGKARELVVSGAKSGLFWALDRDTGAVVWSTRVGPGGTLGGMEWGSATDGTRIYAALNNTFGIPFTPAGSSTTTTFGAWTALDPATGQILWQTTTPDTMGPGFGSAVGALTVANGVVYGCSFAGTWVALNARTGGVLWSQYSGAPCAAGAAVSQGTVYWGTGYNQLLFQPIGTSRMTALRTP